MEPTIPQDEAEALCATPCPSYHAAMRLARELRRAGWLVIEGTMRPRHDGTRLLASVYHPPSQDYDDPRAFCEIGDILYVSRQSAPE